MRLAIPVLAAFALAAVTASAWGLAAPVRLSAADHSVTIFDTPAPPYRPINDETGTWGFAPSHIDAVVGEKITFVNPATNTQPHTVTSLAFTQVNGNSTDVKAGTMFDSSPNGRDSRLPVGQSFVLDTSTLPAGQYVYYCSAHPWMVGTFTLTAAS
jgi:plastocyanin